MRRSRRTSARRRPGCVEAGGHRHRDAGAGLLARTGTVVDRDSSSDGLVHGRSSQDGRGRGPGGRTGSDRTAVLHYDGVVGRRAPVCPMMLVHRGRMPRRVGRAARFGTGDRGRSRSQADCSVAPRGVPVARPRLALAEVALRRGLRPWRRPPARAHHRRRRRLDPWWRGCSSGVAALVGRRTGHRRRHGHATVGAATGPPLIPLRRSLAVEWWTRTSRKYRADGGSRCGATRQCRRSTGAPAGDSRVRAASVATSHAYVQLNARLPPASPREPTVSHCQGHVAKLPFTGRTFALDMTA